MSKRRCPFNEDTAQAIKKQETGLNGKGRRIFSAASEKTLQLLFSAAKQVKDKPIKPTENVNNVVSSALCSQCLRMEENELKCYYCEKVLCSGCIETCSQCDGDYCKKCVFNEIPDRGFTICYSCY